MQVTVCVRQLMYMSKGMCVCKFCMCVTFAKLYNRFGVYFCYVKASLSTAETDICKE